MEDSSIASIHVALLPSSGMGHLTPFLRLAASLDSHGYTVTFISVLTTVSSAESSHLSYFFTTYPRILRLEFHLLPFDTSDASSIDPFLLQWETIRHSAHLLPPLLSSTSPSISALITDITLTASILNVVADLPFSNYVLCPSSAAMLALSTYFSIATQHDTFHESYQLQIPGLPPIPNSDIPTLLLDPSNLFKTTLIENSLALVKADGVILNTLDKLEPEALAALNKGTVVPFLPPVVAVGPLECCAFECGNESNQELVFSWLNEQPERSVVYVSFGSRTVLSRDQIKQLAEGLKIVVYVSFGSRTVLFGDQIKQLAEGLKMSSYRFLWVVKSMVVDKEC